MSKDEIEALKSLHKKISTLGRNKQQQFLPLNQRFNFMIYEAVESPLLLSIIESLWLQIGPVFNHISLNFTSEGGQGHEQIIAALEARDANAARVALADDLMKGGDCIIAALTRPKQPLD
jgi:DNA-binding GntR family transcriptional regulator